MNNFNDFHLFLLLLFYKTKMHIIHSFIHYVFCVPKDWQWRRSPNKKVKKKNEKTEQLLLHEHWIIINMWWSHSHFSFAHFSNHVPYRIQGIIINKMRKHDRVQLKHNNHQIVQMSKNQFEGKMCSISFSFHCPSTSSNNNNNNTVYRGIPIWTTRLMDVNKF